MAAIAIQSIFISALLYFFLGLLINSPAGCEAGNILGTNEILYTGNSLQYGSDTLIMQADCNLVFYRGGRPIWAYNTGGLGRNCYCVMQSDGNLVIYEPPQRAIWASNTARGNDYYVLILQSDGNLVIYGGAIWATGTNHVKPALTITGSDPKGHISATIETVSGSRVNASLVIIGSDQLKGPELVADQVETQFSHLKAPRRSKQLRVKKENQAQQETISADPTTSSSF